MILLKLLCKNKIIEKLDSNTSPSEDDTSSEDNPSSEENNYIFKSNNKSDFIINDIYNKNNSVLNCDSELENKINKLFSNKYILYSSKSQSNDCYNKLEESTKELNICKKHYSLINNRYNTTKEYSEYNEELNNNCLNKLDELNNNYNKLGCADIIEDNNKPLYQIQGLLNECLQSKKT